MSLYVSHLSRGADDEAKASSTRCISQFVMHHMYCVPITVSNVSIEDDIEKAVSSSCRTRV